MKYKKWNQDKRLILMKKLTKKKFLLLIATLAILSGCGPSQKEYEQANKRVIELDAQVAALRAELEDVKFGANRVLAQAKSAYEARNDAEAKKLLADLLKRHPSSPESSEATVLLAQVDSRIAAAEIQRKREEERKAQEERLARLCAWVLAAHAGGLSFGLSLPGQARQRAGGIQIANDRHQALRPQRRHAVSLRGQSQHATTGAQCLRGTLAHISAAHNEDTGLTKSGRTQGLRLEHGRSERKSSLRF